jgi:predicted CopG family antitoxin
MKTIKISDEAWQGLMQLKIEYKKGSIDEVIKALLKDTTHKRRGILWHSIDEGLKALRKKRKAA